MKFTGKRNINLHQLLSPIKETGEWDPNDKNLYYLQGEDGLNVGPINGKKLSVFLEHNPLPTQTKIKPIGENAEWLLLYEHPLFQRRKPQVLKGHGLLIDKNFWLLKSGQKDGPFTYHELKNKVENNELLINQQVSYDDGESWFKLYELEDFDRRKNIQKLPSHPHHEDIKKSTLKKVQTTIEHVDEGKRQTEALATLAISHQNKLNKRKKAKVDHILKPQVQTATDPLTGQQDPSTTSQAVEVNNFKYAFIMSLSIVGILYLLFTSDDRESFRKLAGLKEKKSKIEKMKEKAEAIKDKSQDLLESQKEKSVAKEHVKIPKRQQSKTTFKESIYDQQNSDSTVRQMQREPVEQYREISSEQNTNTSDDGYPKESYSETDNYDNLANESDQLVEQDPVKSQVSSETLNDYDENISEPDQLVEERDFENDSPYPDDSEQY